MGGVGSAHRSDACALGRTRARAGRPDRAALCLTSSALWTFLTTRCNGDCGGLDVDAAHDVVEVALLAGSTPTSAEANAELELALVTTPPAVAAGERPGWTSAAAAAATAPRRPPKTSRPTSRATRSTASRAAAILPSLNPTPRGLLGPLPCGRVSRPDDQDAQSSRRAHQTDAKGGLVVVARCESLRSRASSPTEGGCVSLKRIGSF